MGSKEKGIFLNYLKKKRLKPSQQRLDILDAFLHTERHLTTQELFEVSKKRNKALGYATVARTLKLLCECKLSREVRFDGIAARYEHLYGHDHHDHLVCVLCGKITEVVDQGIEELQNKLARKYSFNLEHHRMELFGTCKKCRTGRR